MLRTNSAATIWSMCRCLGIAAITAGLGGCGKPDAAPTSSAVPERQGQIATRASETRSPESPPTPPMATKRRADFSLTAKAFFAEVVDDIPAATKKYGGRIVEVTGEVSFITRDLFDPNKVTIVLDGGPQNAVICNLIEKEPWQKCVHGQTVKVRGRVNGGMLLIAVALHDCEFTVVGGPQAIPLTVAQLLKEIAADEEATAKKYKEKVVLLTGEFLAFKEDGGDRGIELKGDGKRPIRCLLISDDKPFVSKLKPGESVTFLGRLNVTNAGKFKISDDKVELQQSILTRASVLPR
jgi:hypothetical protein